MHRVLESTDEFIIIKEIASALKEFCLNFAKKTPLGLVITQNYTVY